MSFSKFTLDCSKAQHFDAILFHISIEQIAPRYIYYVDNMTIKMADIFNKPNFNFNWSNNTALEDPIFNFEKQSKMADDFVHFFT